MSYEVVYRLPFTDDLGNTKRLDLLQDDFAGSITEADGVGYSPVFTTFEGQGSDKQRTLWGTELVANLFSKTDFEFLDLLKTASEREFRLELYENSNLKHAGYVIPDSVSEAYQQVPYAVRVGAVSLGALQGIPYKDGSDFYEGRATQMQVIVNCLSKLEFGFDIWDSLNMYEDAMDSASTDSPLTQAEIDQSAFIFNDRGRQKAMNCYDVLEAVLKPYVCNLFQDNGVWKIVPIELRGQSRTVRVFNSSGAFQSSTTHNPEDTTYNWVDGNANVKTLPAIREIVSTYEHGVIDNLIEGGSFNDDFVVPDGGFPFFSLPEDWEMSDGGDFTRSFPNQGVSRISVDPNEGGPYGLLLQGVGIQDDAYIFINPSEVVEFNADDTVRIKLRYAPQVLGAPEEIASIKFRFRIGSWYLEADGGWTTTANDVEILDIGDAQTQLFPGVSGFRDFEFISEAIEADGDIEFRLYKPESTESSNNTNCAYAFCQADYYPDGFPQFQSQTFAGERSIDSFSREVNYDILFGDGPTNIHKSAITISDSKTENWTRDSISGGISEVAIRAIASEAQLPYNVITGSQRTQGTFDRYFTDQGTKYVVQYGTYDERKNIIQGDFAEQFESYVAISVSEFNEQQTGSSSGNTSGGQSTSNFDDRYFKQDENLSEGDPETIRDNIELGEADSPTFDGLNIGSEWLLDTESLSGVNRLSIRAQAGNEDMELFLHPIGTATHARLEVSNDPNLNNYNSIAIESNEVSQRIVSRAQGSAGILPLQIRVAGDETLSLWTNDVQRVSVGSSSVTLTVPLIGTTGTFGRSGNNFLRINTTTTNNLSGLILQEEGANEWIIANRPSEADRLYFSASPAGLNGDQIATASVGYFDQDGRVFFGNSTRNVQFGDVQSGDFASSMFVIRDNSNYATLYANSANSLSSAGWQFRTHSDGNSFDMVMTISHDGDVRTFRDLRFDRNLTAGATTVIDSARLAQNLTGVNPATDNASDIGTGALQWRDLHVGRNAYVAGGLFVQELVVNTTKVFFDHAISQGGGKLSTVTGSAGSEVITFEDADGAEFVPLEVDDIIHIQQRTGVSSGTIVKNIWRKVASIASNDITLTTTGIDWTTGEDVGSIAVGDNVVQKGNTTDADRQSYVEMLIGGLDVPQNKVWSGVDDVGGGSEVIRVWGLDGFGATGDRGIAGKVGGSLAFEVSETRGFMGGLIFDDQELRNVDDTFSFSTNGIKLTSTSSFSSPDEASEIRWNTSSGRIGYDNFSAELYNAAPRVILRSTVSSGGGVELIGRSSNPATISVGLGITIDPNTGAVFMPNLPTTQPSSANTLWRDTSDSNRLKVTDPPGVAPSAPTGLDSERSRANNALYVFWNSVADADTYTLERQVGGGGYTAVTTTSDLFYYDSVPFNNKSTSYDFRVKATNSSGDSSYSTVHSESWNAAPNKESLNPTNVSFVFLGSGNDALTWTVPESGAPSSYLIQYAVDTGGGFGSWTVLESAYTGSSPYNFNACNLGDNTDDIKLRLTANYSNPTESSSNVESNAETLSGCF